MSKPSEAQMQRAREVLKSEPLSAYDRRMLLPKLAQALSDERRLALEDAAKESESWWELFDFDSFDSRDDRRFANPNQIAARIRALAADGIEEARKRDG